MPLWLKRPKTIEALNRAFARQREVVLVAQKAPSVEEPGADDVYDVGVTARILDVGPPSDEALARSPELVGSTQVLVQMQRRVAVHGFVGSAGGYQARIDEIDEGPIPAAPDLIRTAVTQFDSYAIAHGITVPQMWPPLAQLHDPGRVADIIAQALVLPMSEKQELLTALDPVRRLEKVVAHMEAA